MNKLIGLMAVLSLAACVGTQPEVEVKPKSGTDKVDYAALAAAGTGWLARPDVQRYIEEKVRSGQFNRPELEAFFGNAVPKPNIINIMDRPGTSRPWYQFRASNVGAARIRGGQAFWQQNVATLDAVSQRYGVSPEVIVAILGIETGYGSNMGSFRLADSLTTLAFNYPRRAEYFRKELDEFLQMAHEERQDMLTFNGSYAGAMGMPQFMPSSYRKWAVDFDGDGHRDIWRNTGDATASVANYLKQHGWRTGGQIAVPVSLTLTPELQALVDAKTELKYTVADFKRMGVTPLQAVADHEKAMLYALETAPGQYQYYLGLTNFYAIWQYNHSRLYVTAVKEIAEGIRSGSL